jgi:uncharacterized membrane protein
MFLASVIAGLAFLVLPFVGVIIGLMQMPFLNSDGTPDDAPVRGGAALVLMSPIIFVIVASVAFVIALVLKKLQCLTPQALIVVVLAASGAVGAWFAASTSFGWLDALIAFVIMGGSMFLASGFAAWTWWRVAVGRRRAESAHDLRGA